MTRLRLVLLDANVVIHIFGLGIWEQITQRCNVLLAQTVIDEVEFYDTDSGRQYIDWRPWVSAGAVKVAALPARETRDYCDQFGCEYYEKLDPGEAESLALLDREADARICSADKIVWRVLGNLNQGDRGISLEEILTQIGFGRSLPERFSKAFREKWTKIGGQERIMGRGMAD